MREEEKQYNMKKLGNESTRGGKIGEGGGRGKGSVKKISSGDAVNCACASKASHFSLYTS